MIESSYNMRCLKKRKTLFVVITTLVVFTLCVVWTGTMNKSRVKWPNEERREKDNRVLVNEYGVREKHLWKTVPPFYPLNGTGVSVNIAGVFDTSVMDSFCAKHPEMQAIVPIYSACENVDRRIAVRQTLGRTCIECKCKLFFIVGVSKNETVNNKVKDEMEREKDILVIDKIDTYRDLNNKAVAMLDWLIAHCTEPKYVIHCLDDAYVDFRYFLNQLKGIKYDNYIYGFHQPGSRPGRVRGSKIYLSRNEYPLEVLPNYIYGPAYAFLNSNTKTLRENVHKVDYCWVEDYWLTGHVARESGTTLIASNLSVLQGSSIRDGVTLRNFFYIHPVTVSGFYDIFKRTSADKS